MVDGILKQAKKGAAMAAVAQSGSSTFGELASSFSGGGGSSGRRSSVSSGGGGSSRGGGGARSKSSGRRASMAAPSDVSKSLTRRSSFEDVLKKRKQQLQQQKQQGGANLQQAAAAKSTARSLRNRHTIGGRMSKSASAAMGDDLRYSSLGIDDDPESGLAEPLLDKKSAGRTDSLSSFGSGSDDDTDDEDKDSEDASSLSSEELLSQSLSGKDIFTSVLVSLVATGGVAASIGAMVAMPTAIPVLIMGGVCALNSPTIAHKHITIAKSVGVRDSLTNLRQEIHLLNGEIDFLSESLDDLNAELDGLAGLEEQLQEICTKQGANVNQLVELVNENEEIVNSMKANLRQTVVAAMAKVVMRSDVDGDMQIDIKEIPILSLRLRIQLEPYGIKLDQPKFEAMIEQDNCISTVMKFCGNLLFQDEDEESDHGDDEYSVESGITFDFDGFCKNMESQAPKKMTIMDMVTVGDQYAGGSVEVAQAGAASLMPTKNKKEERRKNILKEVKKRQGKLSKKQTSLGLINLDESSRSAKSEEDTFRIGNVVIRGTSGEF